MGASYLGKEYEADAYCPKCKASRFLEVDSGDGQPKRQLTIPVKIVRCLPFIPRIQRLYMTEDSAQQMTWQKKGVRYNPDKIVHPFDGESWKHFDAIHHEKAREAHNVRVALATDGFNSYGMMPLHTHVGPRVRYSSESPPGPISMTEHICIIDYSRAPGE